MISVEEVMARVREDGEFRGKLIGNLLFYIADNEELMQKEFVNGKYIFIYNCIGCNKWDRCIWELKQRDVIEEGVSGE